MSPINITVIWLFVTLVLIVDSFSIRLAQSRSQRIHSIYSNRYNSNGDTYDNRYYVRSILLECALEEQKEVSILLESERNEESGKLLGMQSIIKKLRSKENGMQKQINLQSQSIEMYKARTILLEEGIGNIREENFLLKQKLRNVQSLYRNRNVSSDRLVNYIAKSIGSVRRYIETDGIAVSKTYMLSLIQCAKVLMLTFLKFLAFVKKNFIPRGNSSSSALSVSFADRSNHDIRQLQGYSVSEFPKRVEILVKDSTTISSAILLPAVPAPTRLSSTSTTKY
jgi:hypothetical protein